MLTIVKEGFYLTFKSSQFNSKHLFKDVDPVSLQLIFPGAIQICEQYILSYIYTNKGSSDKQQANTTYTFIQN